MDAQRQQRLDPLEPPQDSEWNVLKDLQSLNGPHLDRFIQKFLDKTKGEELEFEMLAAKLSEAISIFEGKEHPAIEGTKDKKKESETVTSTDEVGNEIDGADKAQSSMSPAERVMDLLDRTVVAGQPLLQRIIRAEDKDLDQLLAELDADEALANKGLPPMRRPLVQSPNMLNVDMLSRMSGVSPTRALLKGQTDEGDWDVDGEDDVKRLMEEWMKQGEKIRKTGRGRLWNRKQRRQMAQLLEEAKAQGLPEESTVPEELEIDTSRIQALMKSEPHDEKWFTTKPSIGLTQPLTHPRTHSIPVASLHFRSHHHHLLTFQTHFVLHSAYMLGIPVSNPVHLPTQRTLVTVLRSPFVHKKSMENWERRTYKRVVKVWDCRSDVLAGWLAYVERNAVAGVGMRITRWEWASMDMLEGGEGQEIKVKDYKEDDGKTDGPAVDLSSLESTPGAALDIRLDTP
jgi:ribosomal protein S10